ncbi:hypothetical protein [Lewinella sp. IMCC34183]|uniref:hypothetical protein n=1 Tax=Lewinella sp. IMCC34183 TaxID=2248762 RepID=UPI000E239CBC|nr:hypothetical protein [Lewinella sp. IMCC34183]
MLTGLLRVNGGPNKFFNYMPVPDDLPNDFTALMEIEWVVPLTGAWPGRAAQEPTTRGTRPPPTPERRARLSVIRRAYLVR